MAICDGLDHDDHFIARLRGEEEQFQQETNCEQPRHFSFRSHIIIVFHGSRASHRFTETATE